MKMNCYIFPQNVPGINYKLILAKLSRPKGVLVPSASAKPSET